jgi:pimeloyl-ACP methyl ester carboxylesterase
MGGCGSILANPPATGSTPSVLPINWGALTLNPVPGSQPPLQWLINDVTSAYASSRDDIKIIAVNAPYAQLASAAYAEGSVAPVGWTVIGGEQTPTGMSATVFQNTKTGEVVVSFRGTPPDEPLNGPNWNTNARLVIGENINNIREMQDALRYATEIQQRYGNVIFTGHSVGGSMAQYAATQLGSSVRAIAFDAVPLALSLLSASGKIVAPGIQVPDYPNITNFRGPNDIATALGEGVGRPAIVVKNDPSISIKAEVVLGWSGFKYNHDIDSLALSMRAVEVVSSYVLSPGQ